jgi:retinol-binding protein 3
MIRRIVTGVLIGVFLATAAAGGEPFTPQARAQTLDRLAGLIEANYVFKDAAKILASEIRGWKDDPALLAAPDQRSFASILTARLVKKDGHFNIMWNPRGEAPAMNKASNDDAAVEREMAARNYGFDAVERLPGNIGYIRMSFFADFDPGLTGAKAPAARLAGEAALKLVENTDAVIFDMRENHGGSPAMIDLLLSGFFGDKPVLLNRFYKRKNDQTVDFTTLANFGGKRRPGVPIYVLVSGSTGSAAEEFSYDVQTRKRGTLIGETTYGGANPGEIFEVGDGFAAFISTGAAVNPITGTNWEKVGVKPDVAIASADALTRAEELAIRAIIAKGGPPAAMTEAQWTLDRITAEEKPVKLDPKSVQEFVGSFDDRQVGSRNGGLFYKRARSPEEPLVPLGGDAFAVADRPDLRITFERDAKGDVYGLLIESSDGMVTSHKRNMGEE